MVSDPAQCCIGGKDVAAVKDPAGVSAYVSCTDAPVLAGAAPPVAPPQDPAADDSPKALCSRCRKLLPETDLRFIAGNLVCESCLSPAAAAQRVAGAGSSSDRDPFVRTHEEVLSNPIKFKNTLAGGGIIAAAVLFFSFVLFFALYQALPDPSIQGASSCAIAAFVRTFILVCSTVGLIVSMAIASVILGGINFGYFGPLVYKSLLFCLGLAVFNFFMDRSESFAIIGMSLRLLAILVALIALFKIDMFEALLLSLVNIGLSWVLTILLLGMMFSLGASAGHDRDEDSLDPDRPHMTAPKDLEDALGGPVRTFPAHPLLGVPAGDANSATAV